MSLTERSDLKNYDLNILPVDPSSKWRRVVLTGCLDSHTAVAFSKDMHQLLDEGTQRLVLDLDNLTYISSAGISELMGLTHRLRQDDGDLVLLKPSEKVYRVFRTLGFTSIFKIVEDESELEAAFSG